MNNPVNSQTDRQTDRQTGTLQVKNILLGRGDNNNAQNTRMAQTLHNYPVTLKMKSRHRRGKRDLKPEVEVHSADRIPPTRAKQPLTRSVAGISVCGMNVGFQLTHEHSLGLIVKQNISDIGFFLVGGG